MNLQFILTEFSIDPCSVTDTPSLVGSVALQALAPFQVDSGPSHSCFLTDLHIVPGSAKEPWLLSPEPRRLSLRAGPALPRSLHEASRRPASSSNFPKVLADPALMQPQPTHISKNTLFLSLLPVSRVPSLLKTSHYRLSSQCPQPPTVCSIPRTASCLFNQTSSQSCG